jgi:hypothetical protein
VTRPIVLDFCARQAWRPGDPGYEQRLRLALEGLGRQQPSMVGSGPQSPPRPLRAVSELPAWPGRHYGTGRNDHLHHWEWMRAVLVDGTQVAMRACQICGEPHPDDLASLEDRP